MADHSSKLWLPWIVKLAISWLVAGALLTPWYLGEQRAAEAAKIPRFSASYEPRGGVEELPEDDERLRGWAEQEASSKVRVAREEDEDGVKVTVSFRARTVGQELDVPWDELGYDVRRGMTTRSSTTRPVWKVSGGVWVLRGSVLASLGYLMFGLLAWRRRPRATPSATVRRSLLLGSAVGAVVAACSWAASKIPGDWASYPQITPWFFEFLSSGGNDRLVVFTVVGVLVVPLAQELFFRQALFARASAAGRPLAGAVVASAVGAVHLWHAPWTALLLFGAGLGSCWVMHRTGRLLAAVASSMVAAGLGFALLWYGRYGLPTMTEFVDQLLGATQPK